MDGLKYEYVKENRKRRKWILPSEQGPVLNNTFSARCGRAISLAKFRFSRYVDKCIDKVKNK